VKAIQGDVSDNVGGVGGIGEKGAIELINAYGSVTSFLNQVLVEKTVSYDSLPKKFKDLVDLQEKQEIFHRNMMLMDLNHPSVPKPTELVRNDGAFDPTAYEAFCREFLFKSMLTDLPGWMAPFNPNPEELQEAA
jgi:5'-3' exonuclease